MQITNSTLFTLKIINTIQKGKIHSVYRKTINILFNSQLIAIQCVGSPLSPISMISDLSAEDFNSLDVNAGDLVSVTASKLIIHREHKSDLSFDFSKCEFYSTFLDTSLSTSNLKTLQESIQSILLSGECDGIARIRTPFPNSDIPLYLPVAEKDLQDSFNAFNSKHWNESACFLGRLIGLGIGLTPCGDDFLCGALAGLILCGRAEHPFTKELKEYIHQHLADTNDISSAFLNCALQQHFSLPVHLAAQGIPTEIIDTLFKQIGHSSGMDTLCGISYILELKF